MAQYDFSTLNSADLEELICDLLNADQSINSEIKYKTFKDGKDKGIDFLHSTNINIHEHVGQVKHYYRTGYPNMLKDLKKTEVAKVKKLSPNKYIFATSVDLTVGQSNEIKTIFNPYIRNLNDIFGKKDINRLLEKHDQVLKNHFKLWLSGASILTSILNSQLQFRSANFIEHELKKRLRLFVDTPIFKQAQIALAINKFVLITGQPGVGKTTLAEMLIYKYLAEGYSVNYVLDIKEAESVLIPDDSKQIIYFDDFLGSTAIEINKAKGSETRLRSVLRRIPTFENKFIVFTTRAHLLNIAIEESEQLKTFNLKAKSSLFELQEYSTELRKEVVLNHIAESNLNQELKDAIESPDILKYIINNSNFTPRIIESICSSDLVGDFNAKDYKKFIKEKFGSMEEIWKHAYVEQIQENDRLLLNTLLSFGEAATVNELEKAFLKRLEFEIEHNGGKKEILAFSKSFKRLDGSLIFLKDNIVNFINPSIIDFLLQYLRKDHDEVLRIARSVKYASQLTVRLFSLARINSQNMPKDLQSRLLDDYLSFISDSNVDYDLIQLALVIQKYIDNDEKTDVICEIINEINDFESLHSDYSLNNHFKEFLSSVKGSSKINEALEERIIEIINDLIKGEYSIETAIELLEDLINSFEIDLSFIDTSELEAHFDYLFEERIANDIDMLMDYILDESEADEKLEEIKILVIEINNLGLYYEPNLDAFNLDWYDIAMENEFRRQMEKDN
jgi:GTPase SAR1 family protein